MRKLNKKQSPLSISKMNEQPIFQSSNFEQGGGDISNEVN